MTVSPDPCPLGFDRDEFSGECVENFVGEGAGTGGNGDPGGNGNSGGSGGGSPPPPPEPACTEDQIAFADEYNDPVNWPCTAFEDWVTPGNGTHGHQKGYLDDGFLYGSADVFAYVAAAGVSGAYLESDWRCPVGNAAVGGVAGSTHTEGRAGDFTAPGFNEETHGKFTDAAGNADASWSSGYGTGNQQYTSHIHIHW